MVAKTVTVEVPIEVRKIGPDVYQYRMDARSPWQSEYSEAEARDLQEFMGARAICKAIDSGAFVDPLPTAVGSMVLINGVTFSLSDIGDENAPWVSTSEYNGAYWHTPAQVQSYGEFRVLWDGEKGED